MHVCITHDMQYMPIFDILIQLKLCRYCITGLMYHDMAIYQYIVASLVCMHLFVCVCVCVCLSVCLSVCMCVFVFMSTKYYPCPTLLNFNDQMRIGAFSVVWTCDVVISVPRITNFNMYVLIHNGYV